MIPSRSRARGFATLMAVLVLLIVVGLSLTVALQMGASSVSDSAAQSDHIEALFLAESGLERTAQQYTGSTACGAGLAQGPIGLGRGTFEVLPTPVLAGTVCLLRVVGRVGAAARTIETEISGGGAPIAVDRVSNRRENSRSDISWNHQVGGVDRLLVVGVSFRNPAQAVTAVTYAGVSLVRAGGSVRNNTRVELWYLSAPPTGNNTVQVTLDGTTAVVAGAVSLTGVDQAFPISASAFNAGTSNNASVTITPNADGAWVVDVLSKANNDAATESPAQDPLWDVATGGGGVRIRGAGSALTLISPVTPVAMSWSLGSSQDWAIGAVAVRPAAAAQAVAWREVVN